MTAWLCWCFCYLCGTWWKGALDLYKYGVLFLSAESFLCLSVKSCDGCPCDGATCVRGNELIMCMWLNRCRLLMLSCYCWFWLPTCFFWKDWNILLLIHFQAVFHARPASRIKLGKIQRNSACSFPCIPIQLLGHLNWISQLPVLLSPGIHYSSSHSNVILHMIEWASLSEDWVHCTQVVTMKDIVNSEYYFYIAPFPLLADYSWSILGFNIQQFTVNLHTNFKWQPVWERGSISN